MTPRVEAAPKAATDRVCSTSEPAGVRLAHGAAKGVISANTIGMSPTVDGAPTQIIVATRLGLGGVGSAPAASSRPSKHGASSRRDSRDQVCAKSAQGAVHPHVV